MRNRQKERFLILGSLFEECIGSLGQAENTFGIIDWDEGFVCRFPPVPMSIAIGMLVNKISLVISMILEPTKWSTALAKKTADIALSDSLSISARESFFSKSTCLLFITTSCMETQPTRAVVIPNWMLAREEVQTGEGQ